MQRLEVSGAVRLIYKSLGVKGLNNTEHKGVILEFLKHTELDCGTKNTA